jgi:hypothetical protein
MDVRKFEEKAKNILFRLGLGHWRVRWFPDSSYSIR